MVWQPRKLRFPGKPSRVEVNIRAIPLLEPQEWKLYEIDKFPLVGTVPKNYLAYGNPQSPSTLGYIAKMGRLTADARECVTEEIISKIGKILPLRMARSKLVRISKHDVRFLSRNFVVYGQDELIHGIELAARYFEAEPAEVELAFTRENEKELYSIKNILIMFKHLYPSDFQTLRDGFFRMLAFDAFVGAPDRHAMNWGILAPLHKNSQPVRFSPIFDTARGLFREYSDSDLIAKSKQQGREHFLTNYANRSKPIISTDGAQPDNHFSLVKWVFINYPDLCNNTMRKVFNAVDIPTIEQMLQRRFRRIITQNRIGFIRDLLAIRIERLQREAQV